MGESDVGGRKVGGSDVTCEDAAVICEHEAPKKVQVQGHSTLGGAGGVSRCHTHASFKFRPPPRITPITDLTLCQWQGRSSRASTRLDDESGFLKEWGSFLEGLQGVGHQINP